MSVIHVLLEGGKDGSQDKLWRNLNTLLFDDILVLHNAGGIDRVEKLFKLIYPELSATDILLICIDVPFNNDHSTRCIGSILEVANKPNVAILQSICTEDTLLRFTYLIQWLYTPDVYKSVQFNRLPVARAYKEYLKYGKQWFLSQFLKDYMIVVTGHQNSSADEKDKFLDSLSTENVAYIVLSNLLNGRSNFKVSKGDLGDCWFSDCNNLSKCRVHSIIKSSKVPFRAQNPSVKCGLYLKKKTAYNKARMLYTYTALSRRVSKARNVLLHRKYDVAKLFTIKRR